MQRVLMVIILCAYTYVAGAQSRKTNVDSIVATLKIDNNDDPEDIAGDLTKPFKTDSEKVRAIYYWVTENIAYDYKLLGNGFPLLYGDPDKYYDFMIRRTLQKKMGVCSQYAALFAELCKHAGITCAVIEGWGLSTPNNVLRILVEDVSNHAWNAVRVNGQWYLMDLTWASGCKAFRKKRIKGERNDFYYMTKPELFVLTHHPEQKGWQLLDAPLNMWHFIGNTRKARSTSRNLLARKSSF